MVDERDYREEKWSSDASESADAGECSTTRECGRVPAVRGWVLRDDEYTLTGEKAVWRECERWICDRYDWDDVDSSTHDAVGEDGGKVEVKSCVWRQQDGSVGRVKVWDEQLLTADKIAVIVYAPTCPQSVIGYTVMDTDVVPRDQRLWKHNTMGWDHGHPLPWTDVLGLEDVRLGLRHGFTEFFDESPDDVIVLDGPDYS